MAHLKRVTDYIFENEVIYDPAQFRRMIATLVARLTPLQPDAIVATGVSGLVVAPIVAFEMRLPLVIVRKDDDKTTHSKCTVEGTLSDRYVLVDDFISSGRTLARVWHRLVKEHEYHDLRRPTLIGICEWQRLHNDNNLAEVRAYIPPDSDGFVAISERLLFRVPVIGGRQV